MDEDLIEALEKVVKNGKERFMRGIDLAEMISQKHFDKLDKREMFACVRTLVGICQATEPGLWAVTDVLYKTMTAKEKPKPPGGDPCPTMN